MEAAMISVSRPWMSKIATMSSIRVIPTEPISSTLPRKGETYVAPALAAISACVAEKISVTFVFTPFADRILTAFRPSSVIGILITMFSWILTSSSASATMPLWSRLITSALMGPSTIVVISFTTSTKSLPSFAIREGFVVTPQITPRSFASLMWSTLAVSMNIFMVAISPFYV